MAAPAPQRAFAAESINNAPPDVLRARGPRRFGPDAQRRRRLFQLLCVQVFVELALVLGLRRPRAGRRVSEALERHHRVIENYKFMTAISIPNANSEIPDVVVLRVMLCYVKSVYYHHFIGADFYRDEYKRAFSMLEQLEEKAVPLSRDDSSGFSAEVRRVLAYARDNRLE